MLEKTLLFVIGLTLVASRRDPFYRKDYTFVEQYDAFYKFHWDGNGHSWEKANLTCEDEESALFNPTFFNEWTVVKTLVAAMKEKPNVTDIILSMSNTIRLGKMVTNPDGSYTEKVEDEETKDILKKTCITMNINTGISNFEDICEIGSVKPFVCKKNVEACPTVDSGYTYVKEVKKCYKVNQRKKTWDNAQKTCDQEGGVLASITERMEAEVIKKMLPDHQDYFNRLQLLSILTYENGTKYIDPAMCNYYDCSSAINQDLIDLNCGAWSRPKSDIGDMYAKIKNCSGLSPFVCEMVLPSKP